MQKTSRPFLRRNGKGILWGFIVLCVLGLGIVRILLVSPYTVKNRFSSDLADALHYFSLTTSVHHDAVTGCWYDSGDYVVFLSRDALAAWYLSMAYRESTDELERNDIQSLLRGQLVCLDEMMARGVKQFRDQKNHGVNLPPMLNQVLYPQNSYMLSEGEGRDTALLLALTYENLGETSRRDAYTDLAQRLTFPTSSAQCCEEGPVVMSTVWLDALETLRGIRETGEQTALWGAQPPAIATLESGNVSAVAGVLEYVEKQFTETGVPFQYIGGNYDIAGTIVLERLYARKTHDERFLSLSRRLMGYLEGENVYRTDFTHYPNPYHPCRFFRACVLSDVLVNGVDDRGIVPPTTEPWRVEEVQTYGQAIYVLAKVLLEP